MDNFLGYFTVLTTGLCFAIYYYLKKKYSFWQILNVPGPKPSLLFGNIKENLFGKKFIGDIFADIYRQYPDSKYVGVYIITSPALLIRDLNLIRDVLIKDFDKFNDRGVNYSDEGLGKNLFHADSDAWSVLRKRMSPSFSTAKLKKMFYLIKNCADDFMSYVETEFPDNRRIDAFQFTPKYTMHVICSCAFGLDADSCSEKYNVFLDMGEKIFKPNWKLLLETLFPGSMKKFNFSPFDQNVINFFYDLYDNMELERRGKPATRNDLMDMLLEMKGEKRLVGNKVKTMESTSLEMNRSVIASQVFLFFGAGYETTASTMAYLLYELARHQHVQDKVIEEIDQAFEKNHGDVNYETISELEYLNMTIMETLRKHPIVEPLQRQSLTDYTIPGTNVTIPKGTNVFISSDGVNNDPKYWPDPEKFDPDRFSIEEKQKRHSMSFLSFGEGPKICMGARFAKISATTGIAYFLRKYRVYATEETPQIVENIANRFVAQPKNPLIIEIRRRSNA